jgi:hypothetical protein
MEVERLRGRDSPSHYVFHLLYEVIIGMYHSVHGSVHRWLYGVTCVCPPILGIFTHEMVG